MHTSQLLLALATTLASTTYVKATRSNSVSLSSVKSLTLRDGALTSARRVEPIPQLTCVGGNAKDLYNVDVMRCENAGYEYDAADVQWTCKASLPPEFKLGSTDVICEGFDSPDDPHVLKGSCGVEYRLVLTPVGEEKYGGRADRYAYSGGAGGSGVQSAADRLFTALFWLVFIGVLCLIIYRTFIAPPGQDPPGGNRRVGRNGGGGGGGGGPDDRPDDNPPPPYTPRNPKSASDYSTNDYQSQPGQQRDGTWRPGFWTGAATAAAAGYAANAFGNRSNNTRPTRNRVYGYDDQRAAGPSNRFGRTRDPSPPRRSNNGGGGSSWFGGGGGGASSSRSNSGYTSSNSFSSPSSSRHESTGFGGTSRR
ncbi:hypothetical protein LTR86_002680 [Recurvomyces mirabilis]|nr:hypothetical protein LTR86_002680 [Recurvomyces mirabilis]